MRRFDEKREHMRLRELCKDMRYRLMQGNDDVEVSDIIYDSRKAKPAAAFVCIAGAVTDGHKMCIRDRSCKEDICRRIHRR